ncbi:DNA-3-methyladenine glycosylase family protein [Nocardia sp. NPDC127526]|uniref:DNA-3-methyladenine glycosylase family protein n=1 Tax=Nocardia sp. NPDC127526 TaxID=3345393 RepID=UPI00363D9471
MAPSPRDPVELTAYANFTLRPPAPFDFDSTTSKPSTLPDPTNHHEPGVHWQTIRWDGRLLGIRMDDNGSRDDPKIGVTVFASGSPPRHVLESLDYELRWRYDLDTDLSWYCRHFADDPTLAGPLERIGGMRVSCAFSLYEWVSVLALLQMATAGRISRMVNSVFDAYGTRLRFDGRELQAFWQPRDIVAAGEGELRAMKLGYRAKSLVRIAESVLDGGFDEDALRAMDRAEARRALLTLYGIGPASVGNLLFMTLHHYDSFDVVPPWDAKLYAHLLYDTDTAPAEQIVADMTDRYGRWRALAGDYLLEDLFLRHQREPIDWLAAEIRM